MDFRYITHCARSVRSRTLRYTLGFVFSVIVAGTLSTEINAPLPSDPGDNGNRVFEVDYENNQFLKDGEPFHFVSGSLHYFRVPRQYWQDRLRKLRAAGLNAVATYIEWSSHEPREGAYDFTGDNDLEHFVQLAQQEGLLVILRPGPYICAERDLGGYPAWLFHKNPKMVLRTSDPSHVEEVQRWLSVLMPKLQPLLYGNGGPVIMVQVENEYGSYPICDKAYMRWLADVFSSYVDTKAVLFTADGPESHYLVCGAIPGIFITVNFGPGRDVAKVFEPLRKVQPHGPLVNMEFYPGWLTRWGETEARVSTAKVVETTRQLLAAKVSFNFFMFFGGTNFGFTSGANNPPFLPQITSYDYDAPISEAGDLTNKYFALKSVFSKVMTVQEIPVYDSTKMSYGTLVLEAKTALLDSDKGIVYGVSTYPKTFEALQQYSGLMLYETMLPLNFSGKGDFVANNIHDRAIVYIGKKAAGVLSRTESDYGLIISAQPGEPLSLLVENQGHINFKEMLDLKGLVENPTLRGDILINWKHTGYPLTDVSHIADLPTVQNVQLPAFYAAKFQVPEGSATPADTFVDMTGWTKGVIYVNGHNLGRYWPVKGPQVTLYLPASYLNNYPEYNTVVVLELERASDTGSISFVTSPVWTTPSVMHTQ